MIDTTDYTHFHYAEKLVNVLMTKTQNNNPLFFRVLVAYYLSKISSMMRTNVNLPGRGEIPTNIYAINLATSGFGKGLSTNIIEEKVIDKFKGVFLSETFPFIAEQNLRKEAKSRATKLNLDPDDVLIGLENEFAQSGALAFSFDSGTTAAIKQMRHKLLLAKAGSLNLEIDEIGSNLISNTEVLNAFLELFDVGKIKQKLTKNTKENIRFEEIDGRTPTNMMLYGTPSKLLSPKVESDFHSMLETGYARRCLFGYAAKAEHVRRQTGQEIFDMLNDVSTDAYLDSFSLHLEKLGKPNNFGTLLTMSDAVAIELFDYKAECEYQSAQLGEYEEVQKAELNHRYYKAVKLAGTYAFIDESAEIKQSHLHSAIKLVEESGEAFLKILTRERNHVKLAKHISNTKGELTHADLVEDLPFYRGSDAQKKEMITLAIAYGYKNNIIIKKSYSDNIEFISGETIQETDLDKIVLSYSDQITEGYENSIGKWENLHRVVTADGFHYCAHHFKNGYRSSSHAIEGFNLAIIDVDKDCHLDLAKQLLNKYTYLIATTKRHTEDAHRFRIILPLSHSIKLNYKNYSKFMKNLYNWLPFSTDDQTSDIARKWQSHNGEYFYNEGNLLDATLFIPETKKEEEQNQRMVDISDMDNLERWFLLNSDSGNRNNQILKLGLALVDNGLPLDEINDRILAFNKKLKNPLEEIELQSTVLVTVLKSIAKRENNNHV